VARLGAVEDRQGMERGGRVEESGECQGGWGCWVSLRVKSGGRILGQGLRRVQVQWLQASLGASLGGGQAALQAQKGRLDSGRKLAVVSMERTAEKSPHPELAHLVVSQAAQTEEELGEAMVRKLEKLQGAGPAAGRGWVVVREPLEG
jgi:hypothetical protein